MNAKEYDGILEALSRRKFLKIGSAVLPTTALPGVAALPGQIVADLATLKPGGMRELHWHPHSSEWQYWIAGQGRMTVFFPADNVRVVDFKANDIGW